LTDGEVSNREKKSIITYIAKQSQAKVHTFGIGRECDRELILEAAKAGKGTASFADENSELASNVVNALRKSFEPQLQNCSLSWSTEPEATYLGEVFRDQVIQHFKIMSAKDFQTLKVTFKADKDPITKKSVNVTFKQKDWQKSDLPLFHLAAYSLLPTLPNDAEKIRVSLKYQVLHKLTAMVGTVRIMGEKQTEDMVQFKQKFEKPQVQGAQGLDSKFVVDSDDEEVREKGPGWLDRIGGWVRQKMQAPPERVMLRNAGIRGDYDSGISDHMTGVYEAFDEGCDVGYARELCTGISEDRFVRYHQELEKNLAMLDLFAQNVY
jgi:hypothetical protein